MFNFKVETKVIQLPCGVMAMISPLSPKHQRKLTEQGTSNSDKFNAILADVIVSIEGVDWNEMEQYKKIKFVEKMLSADRRYILTESRQLANRHKPTFTYVHEWKDKKGVKKETPLEIHLIDEDNRDSILEGIKQHFDESHYALIEKLNSVGCFPTKPYRKQFNDYSEVIAPGATEVVFDLELSLEEGQETYEFSFKLMNGLMEKEMKPEKITSHSKLTARQLRARKKGTDMWVKVEDKHIDDMPMDVRDEISRQIDLYEGDVDSVEIIDNPDETAAEKTIRIDLIAQVGFFFLSGRV